MYVIYTGVRQTNYRDRYDVYVANLELNKCILFSKYNKIGV